MQIVSNGDKFHERLNPIFWEKYLDKKNIKLWSAELAQWVVNKSSGIRG